VSDRKAITADLEASTDDREAIAGDREASTGVVMLHHHYHFIQLRQPILESIGAKVLSAG
jgi:hypothetical protein